MRRKWTLIAVLLVLVAVVAYLLNLMLGPQTLRIAVGPIGSPNLRVIVGFLQALQHEHAPLRLKVVMTEGTAASVLALEERRADLAVVRSDIAVPAEAGTVAILRLDAVYFLTRPGSGIEKLRDLRGKRIGLASKQGANVALLGRVLGYYGMALEDITLIQGSGTEIRERAVAGGVDAQFIVAPVSDRAGREAYLAMAKAGQGEPGILAIPQAETIIGEAPVFTSVELTGGLFERDPPRPEDNVTTLAVSHRLVAQHMLDETTVSDLTRLLFALRLVIARETPAANEIELPSTDDRGAKLPVHGGTIAYVEGETKTFFDRFGDWFYFGVMVLSLGGSLAAAVWSRMEASRHPLNIDQEMRDLLRLISEVRNIADAAQLAAMKPALDENRTRLLAVVTAAPMGERQAANLRFLLEELREVYRERLEVLRKSS